MSEQIIQEPIIEEPIIEEPVKDEPIDEPTDEPVIDEEPSDEPIDEPESPKSDHVPLTKYMNEKKKRQELERMLSQQEAQRKELETFQGYLDRGYPEYEAKNLAKRDVSHERELEALKSRFQDTEIKDLARSNDFYSDAETFADEIKDKMKSLDISAKEAYMLLRGDVRVNEVRTKQEQLAAVKRKQTVSKKVSSATPIQTPTYKLDEDDKKALEQLRKAQPEVGWTAEKYYKIMKE